MVHHDSMAEQDMCTEMFGYLFEEGEGFFVEQCVGPDHGLQEGEDF